MSFHINDSQGKVAAHKATHKVNYEYSDYVDKEEQVYRNVYGMASLSKSLKRKAPGVKGSSSHNQNLMIKRRKLLERPKRRMPKK